MPDQDTEAARVRRIYRGYASSPRRRRAWSAENPGNRAIRAELAARALENAGDALHGGGLILDVGCGTGWWLERLTDVPVDERRLVGIDIQEARVEAARRRVPNADLRLGDARHLPIPRNSCDLVTLFTVLSSLQTRRDVLDVLNAAKAALTDRGVLMVYEPRFPNPLNTRTRRISSEELDLAGLLPRETEDLTVIPLIARRLGEKTGSFYPRLSRAGLVTHRLVVYRRT